MRKLPLPAIRSPLRNKKVLGICGRPPALDQGLDLDLDLGLDQVPARAGGLNPEVLLAPGRSDGGGEVVGEGVGAEVDRAVNQEMANQKADPTSQRLRPAARPNVRRKEDLLKSPNHGQAGGRSRGSRGSGTRPRSLEPAGQQAGAPTEEDRSGVASSGRRATSSQPQGPRAGAGRICLR